MINTIKHLLPTGKALSIIVDKTLRRFFEGIAGTPTDAAEYIDTIWTDIFPTTTTRLTDWEKEFGIIAPAYLETDRRERLAAAWRRGGGLGKDTIQDTLQAAGFPLYVHDPWYHGYGQHDAITCGDPEAACGEVSAECGEQEIRRFTYDPRTYLTTGIIYFAECGEALAACGEASAECGETVTPNGYPLVNNDIIRSVAYTEYVTCGEALAACGEAGAECGDNTGFTITKKQYTIPNDSVFWPYFYYVGGETFGDTVNVPFDRKEELETLILKIGPRHMWAGLFVNYGG